MLRCFCGIVYIFLWCSQLAISFTPLPTWSSNHMLFLQLPTVGTLYQPHITITQICSTPPASNVENISSRISYAGLLIHYLTQNVRPKFHLCVNVFSNIIERKGPEAAVKISESLNHNLSADSIRLAKNALLSALVLQKQTDTAASHLRLLLLQQDGYWWLDIAVLADLLQLYMTVDLDDDLEENSQPSHRRERALEASQLYTDIISVNDLSYSQVSDDQVHWENIVQDETYPSSVLLSGSSVHAPAAAINRIHEYGARAFADNEEWEKAVLAVACIGERHLATDALVLFNSRLLSRLVRLEDESSSKSLDDESVSKGSDRTERYSSSRRGLALELALLQPLHLLPPECSILHSCLFQMSSSPGHTDRLIQHIREISERRGKAATNADIQSPQHDPVSTAALIPDNVASELIERLFLRSCTATQLTEAILLLWGTNTSNSIVREEIDNNALRAHQNDAIASIIDVACAIRDAAANKSREVEVGVSMRETPLFSASKSIADLSSKIATALISPCCDSLFTVALNPSLRLLLISLKRANLQHLSSSILQSIVGMTEIQDPELSAWYPDAELLAEALCIGFSQSDPTAVYHEVLDRVKAGEALDAHLLFATFRAATISPTAALSDIAEALWRSMVERGCIQCYEKGPVLASALAFICSHGQGSGNRADVSSSGSGLTKDVKMCCDAVEVALSRSSSILDAADSARSVNSAVRNVFSALTATFARTSGNRGIGDVPRALISLLQRHGASALGEGGRVFRFDNENLQRGAVLSLGLGRINLSERERTGSEGCAYSYSSLLRLSLFLTSISEKELRSLLPSLLHLNEQWPKIILKAFSHRYSSRVADQNAPTSMITLSPDSQVVALILESFDKHVGDALIGGHINQVEGIQSSPVTLQDAFEQCSATLLEGRSYPVVSLPSSDTLAAAIDLCSIGGRPEGEIKDSTRSLSESGKRDEMAFSRCKLYYSIGWLAAGRTGDHTSAPLSGPSPAIDDTDLRSLGLSLNQLSFALLKATQRLSRTVPDAAKIVRQKIEYYAKKTPTVTITDKATNEPMTEGSISVTDETSNLPMTQVTAAAVTYRETRLLCSIAAGGGDASREELMDFWSAVSVVHPSLLGYSTALFELLDAHMGAGNGTGLVQWAMVAVDGGMMLPAMRVKELLVRYANSDTLHCLPSLLPLLAKLGAQQTEGDFDGRPDDAGTSIGTQFAMQRKYAGPSDLSLPLSMAVLRDLCVKLLLQKRLSDASVLLQCVHPVQWPYDELLFALATSIESDSDAPKNEKGNDGRRRECMTVLRRREELSVPVLPIKSATAKALLAMQTETTERTKDSDSESQQSFRIMVARAVKSAASEKRVNVAVDNGLSRVNGDNNNGRIFSIVNVTNTMSESDVRSGLLALLTLYNLTDTVTEAVSEQNSSLNLTPEMQWPSEEKPAGSAGETLSPRTLRWIDPESPENLSKFLSEIESLGGAEATQRQVDAVESGGDVVAIELEGKRMVKMDKIVSNIGLRVSGSKKSWKRGGTFGTSFSQTGSAFPPLQQRASPSLTADESFAEAVESVDILVCKELAQSLLNTVAFQIAAHLKRDADRAIEEGLDLEQQRLEGRKYGASESRGGHGRRMVRDIESRRHTSITGAIRALFSLENQSQADRLFSTFENSDLLCDQLLYLSSLKVDSATAALVVEQMSYQNILLKGSVNDKNTWERIHRIMVDSSHTQPNKWSGSRSDAVPVAVWSDLSKIFGAIRPTVISKLQPDSQGRQGVQGEEASKMLVEILEVGALSYLRSLQDNQDAEISFGDFQHEGESEDVESKSATKVDHWMREGERERAAVVLQATEALKEEAMKSSRALTLELVQLFPKLNVTLSDSLGSELISSFLVSDDVDSSLAILNILLSRGGHASNSACESLAKKLLSKGRHTMARAICRLIHVRGRLCDASFYSFLFASILAPTSQYATTSGAVAILNRSPQRLTSVRDDVRDIGMWLETDTAEGENLRDFQFGATSLDAVSAIDEALQVLSEVSAATYSATNGSPGHFESAPSNMNSKENRMRTISDSLVQIVLKFGYSNSQLERIYSAVAALRNSAKT